MLVGSFPVDDTRRGIVRGPLTDELIDVAAAAYLDLVAALDAGDRLALVPPAGFPHGDLDARLRTSILQRWQERPLLRTASGTAVAPRDARFLPGLRAGTALLGDVPCPACCRPRRMPPRWMRFAGSASRSSARPRWSPRWAP